MKNATRKQTSNLIISNNIFFNHFISKSTFRTNLGLEIKKETSITSFKSNCIDFIFVEENSIFFKIPYFIPLSKIIVFLYFFLKFGSAPDFLEKVFESFHFSSTTLY